MTANVSQLSHSYGGTQRSPSPYNN